MIFVTNKGSQPLVAKYVDQWFEFPPGKSVPIEPQVARHIFGYGDDNKYQYLVRLGWMKMSTDREKAMARLAEFTFTDAPVKDQQSAVLVERVAPPAPRGRAGVKVQPQTSDEAYMATYSGYIAEVRRLLHDAAGNFWTDTELTDYINGARHRVVRDTGCLRNILTGATTTSVETLNIAALTLPSWAEQILDILNINLYWGNTRIPLRYMSWSQFNAELRFWQNYTGRPIAFTRYGQNEIYFGPVPDQVYVIEVDTILLPVPLTSDSQTEVILEPYTSPVAFYAAYKAKYKEQSYGEAEIFNAEYKKQLLAAINSSFTRRLPTPYSIQ